MTTTTKVPVNDYDVLDIVLLCHAALAQDSPYPKEWYLNAVLNLATSYTTVEQRREVEEHLAEKKYLPETKIEIVK